MKNFTNTAIYLVLGCFFISYFLENRFMIIKQFKKEFKTNQSILKQNNFVLSPIDVLIFLGKLSNLILIIVYLQAKH
jgi:calcineurin-like phosphoesterase family protein